MNWDLLIEEDALAAVLPDEYRHFARPIRDGLVLFLDGLPEVDQAAALAAQAALPAAASISQRLGCLARCSPVLHKLGQTLARDQRLAPELRLHLRELESLAPTVPLETIEEVLRQELGPLERRQVVLQPPAIAEASVAVVIPFQQRTGAATREGVFKILKPGIAERLERELGLLERVGSHLDERCGELGIPHLDYEASFQQVKHKLLDEIRLRQEQRHLVQARRFFADEPHVLIPALLEHCTARITAMERVRGTKVTDHKLVERGARRRVAELVARALIARPIFSPQPEAPFHADPHAGNLVWTDDDRLAILDWSLVGTLNVAARTALVQVALAAVTLDETRLLDVLAGLATRPPAQPDELRRIVRRWLAELRRGQLPGLGWLLGLLDDAVQNGGLRVAAELMLFRKSLYTLQGVLAAAGPPGFPLDAVLLEEFAIQALCEWPWRWAAAPESRDFATRLSNADLARTSWSGPATLARFWIGQTRDVLAAAAARWN